MKLFTKSKKNISFKQNNLEKRKKSTGKKAKNEWLLSDETFNSILHCSTPDKKKEVSKIEELLSTSEDEDD